MSCIQYTFWPYVVKSIISSIISEIETAETTHVMIGNAIRVLVELSDALDDQQKKNKVRSIIYAMANRDKTIVNKGSSVKSMWALASKTF